MTDYKQKPLELIKMKPQKKWVMVPVHHHGFRASGGHTEHDG